MSSGLVRITYQLRTVVAAGRRLPRKSTLASRGTEEVPRTSVEVVGGAPALAALAEARERGAAALGGVNVVGSSIARQTDAGAYLHCPLYTSDAADDTPILDLGGPLIL